MKIEMIIKFNVTKAFYKENLKEVCDDIKSGKMQRDLREKDPYGDHCNKGLKKITATVSVKE